MTPWEVIEEALVHRKPRRNLQWLADQLDIKIQVVVNWRMRGVPARRYRDIAAALGITVDQLEGIERLPWETAPEPPQSGLLPAVAEIAFAINELPPAQREWVLDVVNTTINAAKATIRVNGNGVTDKDGQSGTTHDKGSSQRRKAA